ncbi:VOC family protein [Paradesertivirga mongoliensis]|uniref:VOC family protein n=1 Tax=Paradesertivirga mongoliensis TaxID=2100740 RepID=A0ABW4ZP93_9SPHI|nr:VOC family protein [Pedobacter mongoliensis]
MANKIFVNLPVKDLNRSVEFFTKLGFSFNAQFTDENATSMVISDDIYVMLLVEPFFKTFLPGKEISDAKKNTEVLICLSAESKEEVDQLVRLAVEAGGAAPMAKQDHGWMYSHGFEDLDGHLWEVAYMDTSAIPQNP